MEDKGGNINFYLYIGMNYFSISPHYLFNTHTLAIIYVNQYGSFCGVGNFVINNTVGGVQSFTKIYKNLITYSDYVVKLLVKYLDFFRCPHI